jgi:hypothetical protein
VSGECLLLMEAASEWQLSGIVTADRSWPIAAIRCKECRAVECRITPALTGGVRWSALLGARMQFCIDSLSSFFCLCFIKALKQSEPVQPFIHGHSADAINCVAAKLRP